MIAATVLGVLAVLGVVATIREVRDDGRSSWARTRRQREYPRHNGS